MVRRPKLQNAVSGRGGRGIGERRDGPANRLLGKGLKSWDDPPMASRPLSEMLDLPRDARVAAIGGGGKMTLLTTLGVAWAQAGGRPLLAPTLVCVAVAILLP